MSKEERETGSQGALVCPVCKQPVTAMVRGRHKTLGVVVPVWRPGPCHNTECSEHLKESKQLGRQKY
ncbi:MULTISPECIES: hypothetical protein [Streptomyces]|uniref:Uncharacterized protein n=1 Tax=Streptomyces prasinus TaxID=67345 RepID=A0ABX6B027_9ACTN|nr:MULTISPECIES: hypothetical protein [Streptomyces]MCP3769604.1 hypothetical protein [Streptomyces sp. MAR25Y5]OBQ49312.1 hypothetical protein A4U61_30740 [Streptomyces sp. H-KF8]QEV07539.1 hypothetical protein CP972_19520 [Streptomyces prasinus]